MNKIVGAQIEAKVLRKHCFEVRFFCFFHAQESAKMFHCVQMLVSLTSRAIIFKLEVQSVARAIRLGHCDLHSHVRVENWARSLDDLSIDGQGMVAVDNV